jgi:hypothetical protein
MALLTFAATAAGFHSCGFKANYLDLTQRHGGILAGVGNMLASIASSAGPVITSGALADDPDDWGRLFRALLTLNFAGAAVVATWLSVDCLDGVASVPHRGGESPPTPSSSKLAAPASPLRRLLGFSPSSWHAVGGCEERQEEEEATTMLADGHKSFWSRGSFSRPSAATPRSPKNAP